MEAVSVFFPSLFPEEAGLPAVSRPLGKQGLGKGLAPVEHAALSRLALGEEWAGSLKGLFGCRPLNGEGWRGRVTGTQDEDLREMRCCLG